MKINRGSTNVRRSIFIANAISSTGAGLSGLSHNSSGLTWNYYANDLSNVQTVPIVSGLLGTYTNGGFVEISSSGMPGWYELGLPNASLDGGTEVVHQLYGATNMVPVNIYIQLEDNDAVISGSPMQPVVRSVSDITPIRFVWPSSTASITVERSINSGSFVSAAGTVSFFRTEGSDHWYTFSYSAVDRALGIVRYKLNDGTITRYITLQVVDTDLTSIRNNTSLIPGTL